MADTFQVISQRRTSAVGPDGRFTDVMEVTFRTKTGVVSFVDVPVTRFTPDYVRQQIEEHAAAIDGVHGL